MARSHNISLEKKHSKHEQIVEVDEFIKRSAGPVFWLEEHQRVVLIAIAVLLVVAFAGVGGYYFTKNRAGDVSEQFRKAASVALIPVKDEADPSAKDSNGFPKAFKTSEEKAKLLTAQMEEFVKNNSGSSLVGSAYLYIANALFESKKYDDAIGYYEKALKQESVSKDFEFLVYESLGYAYEATGKSDKAMEMFKKLGASKFYPDAGLYHQARMLEKEGKKEEARALYKRVTEEFPNSFFKSEAEHRSAALD